MSYTKMAGACRRARCERREQTVRVIRNAKARLTEREEGDWSDAVKRRRVGGGANWEGAKR